MNRLALTTLLLLLIILCQAQTRYRESTKNTNAWFMYFGSHKFNRSLAWYTEVHIQRNQIVNNWQQLLFITGLEIELKHIRYAVGYGFAEIYPYGEFAVPHRFPQHIIWEQAVFTQPVGRMKLTHRYRLEQRMIGNPSTGKFENGSYENRFRYLFRSSVPLHGTTVDVNEFYLAAYDELFINFGKQVRYNLFDQNRIYAALGFHLGKIGKVEAGFLYQVMQHGALMNIGTDYYNKIENNFNFQFTLFSDLSFCKPPQ